MRSYAARVPASGGVLYMPRRWPLPRAGADVTASCVVVTVVDTATFDSPWAGLWV